MGLGSLWGLQVERWVIDESGMQTYISRAICTQIVMEDVDMNEIALRQPLTVIFSL